MIIGQTLTGWPVSRKIKENNPIEEKAMTEIDLKLSPIEFFREQVSAVAAKQNLELDEELEFYIVNLLVDFINPEKLNNHVHEINVLDTPLALQLKNALEAPRESQAKIYKGLGDTSLYVAGYFQDFFNRKSYDIEYYITLGSNAYVSLSSLMRESYKDEHFSGIYQHLAEMFQQLVEVLAEVSEVLLPKKSANILAIYDRWTRNQSDRLRRQLEDLGINPVPISTKLAQ